MHQSIRLGHDRTGHAASFPSGGPLPHYVSPTMPHHWSTSTVPKAAATDRSTHSLPCFLPSLPLPPHLPPYTFLPSLALSERTNQTTDTPPPPSMSRLNPLPYPTLPSKPTSLPAPLPPVLPSFLHQMDSAAPLLLLLPAAARAASAAAARVVRARCHGGNRGNRLCAVRARLLLPVGRRSLVRLLRDNLGRLGLVAPLVAPAPPSSSASGEVRGGAAVGGRGVGGHGVAPAAPSASNGSTRGEQWEQAERPTTSGSWGKFHEGREAGAGIHTRTEYGEETGGDPAKYLVPLF